MYISDIQQLFQILRTQFVSFSCMFFLTQSWRYQQCFPSIQFCPKRQYKHCREHYDYDFDSKSKIQCPTFSDISKELNLLSSATYYMIILSHSVVGLEGGVLNVTFPCFHLGFFTEQQPGALEKFSLVSRPTCPWNLGAFILLLTIILMYVF